MRKCTITTAGKATNMTGRDRVRQQRRGVILVDRVDDRTMKAAYGREMHIVGIKELRRGRQNRSSYIVDTNNGVFTVKGVKTRDGKEMYGIFRDDSVIGVLPNKRGLFSGEQRFKEGGKLEAFVITPGQTRRQKKPAVIAGKINGIYEFRGENIFTVSDADEVWRQGRRRGMAVRYGLVSLARS